MIETPRRTLMTLALVMVPNVSNSERSLSSSTLSARCATCKFMPWNRATRSSRSPSDLSTASEAQLMRQLSYNIAQRRTALKQVTELEVESAGFSTLVLMKRGDTA